MNTRSAIFAGILLLLLGYTKGLHAQTAVSGTQLEIGPTSSNQVSNFATIYSGAIGTNNAVSDADSLAIGLNNVINGSGSLAEGDGNTVSGYSSTALGTGNSVPGDFTTVIGELNVNYGQSSLVVGSMNQIELGDAGSAWTFVSGQLNQVYDSGCAFVLGLNNQASYASNSATIGRGLTNFWSDCTVVGHYNAYLGSASPVFLVGVGTDSMARSNALEVYDDGGIVIPKRQGDVKMGQFGLNGD